MSEIKGRDIPPALQNPGQWRTMLFHGDDAGLIAERARAAATQVAEGTDPFRFITLSVEEHARLPEESAAMTLGGGRRAILVRDAGDALLPHLKAALAQPTDTLIVLEAGALSTRSTLRNWARKPTDVASIGCYPETGRDLERTIQTVLTQASHGAPPRLSSAALKWLAEHLAANRALVRSEVEKLSLLGSPGQTLSLDDVRAAIGDSAEGSVEQALLHGFAGDPQQADRLLDRALHEGAPAAKVTWALYRLIERLLEAAQLMEGLPAPGQTPGRGCTPMEALKQIKPPVFFKQQPLYAKALSRWPHKALLGLHKHAHDLELATRQSPLEADLACRHFLAVLAQHKGRR
ncbi:DNA polymerase III subunit delta [Formicincola oecophyllae]|uniref:DNA-directed DNA polymerase n=1 Tax=Formicincola oecophyllae TaxID=2558361 RepID=A0A4Y6U9W4_9PROT|nr:DNA polymerase III subunit delta [Formicincola oecophyllae]QDH13246.1 DNA polymerase III subunit delta [Formicincola oecophyllae]